MVFLRGPGARVFCARVMSSILALVLLALCETRGAYAAEPPPKSAYHASIVNGDVLGSAFLIEGGVAVTNAHVVAGRRVGQRVILIGPSGRRIQARIEAFSRQMDLAVLSVRGAMLRIVPAAPRRTRRGAEIVAVGIVARSGDPARRHTIRGTVVSGPKDLSPFGRGVIASMPLVQRGFSGGPVFDGTGAWIGMVAALRPAQSAPSRSREAFILSASDIRKEVDRLRWR